MKLYIYDHCPYCVKARMIFGLKKHPFKLVSLLNDDEETPISMVGVKMVPILEIGKKEFMPESMDIVRYIDEQGESPQINWKENKEVQNWLSGMSSYLYLLTMPRWVKSPLAEFKTKSARDYFQKKKESYIGSFKEALNETSELIEECEDHLGELEIFLISNKGSYFLKEEWNVSHIHLFTALRALSVVKNLKFPSQVSQYMKTMSSRSGVPLSEPVG